MEQVMVDAKAEGRGPEQAIDQALLAELATRAWQSAVRSYASDGSGAPLGAGDERGQSGFLGTVVRLVDLINGLRVRLNDRGTLEPWSLPPELERRMNRIQALLAAHGFEGEPVVSGEAHLAPIPYEPGAAESWMVPRAKASPVAGGDRWPLWQETESRPWRILEKTDPTTTATSTYTNAWDLQLPWKRGGPLTGDDPAAPFGSVAFEQQATLVRGAVLAFSWDGGEPHPAAELGPVLELNRQGARIRLVIAVPADSIGGTLRVRHHTPAREALPYRGGGRFEALVRAPVGDVELRVVQDLQNPDLDLEVSLSPSLVASEPELEVTLSLLGASALYWLRSLEVRFEVPTAEPAGPPAARETTADPR
jgi:hypothetical protein